MLRELKQLFSFLNVRPFYTDVHANSYPHVVLGMGMNGTLPQSFWYVTLFRKDFTFSGKPLIFLQDEVYFVGGSAAEGQQWSPSWILPRFRNQVKTARNGDIFVLDMNNNT